MPTIFVRGDIFNLEGVKAFAHGCNCAGAMGKGIAVEFRSRFPKMYTEYKRRCSEGTFNLGDVFAWTEGNTTVFNLGTQRTWRTKAALKAIEVSVRKMIGEAEAMGITKIGLPRIGAGYGGLPWETVRSVLEYIGSQTTVELIVVEDHVPAKQPFS